MDLRQTKEDFEVRATALGVIAFKFGIKAPAMDNNMLDLMREVNPSGLVGNPNTLLVLKAWHRGRAGAALEEKISLEDDREAALANGQFGAGA